MFTPWNSPWRSFHWGPMPHALCPLPLTIPNPKFLPPWPDHGSQWYYTGIKAQIRHASYLQSQPGCPKLRAVHVPAPILYQRRSFCSALARRSFHLLIPYDLRLLCRILPVFWLVWQSAMKTIIRLLLAVLILISTMAVAGPLGLDFIPHRSISEPAQMLLLGICLVCLAGYSRKRLSKE